MLASRAVSSALTVLTITAPEFLALDQSGRQDQGMALLP